MKQIIDLEQLNELSDEQKERLQEWCIEKGYGDVQECSCGCGDKYLLENSTCLLSIGQCIELLHEKDAFQSEYGTEPAKCFNGIILEWTGVEFIDALWEAVKKVL